MKTFAILAAALALSTCSDADNGDAPLVDETLMAAGERSEGTAPGTYQVTLPDDTIGTSLLMEDGTYLDTFGEQSESGTWSEIDGKICFDPEGDEAPARCYAIGATDADGSFTATPEGGDPVRARKLD